MFKPKETPIVDDIRNARSLKELEAIVVRIGDSVKRKRSKLKQLFQRLSKMFSFSSSSANIGDERIEIGKTKIDVTDKPTYEGGGMTAVIPDYKHPKTPKDLPMMLENIEAFHQHAYELAQCEAVLQKKFSRGEPAKQKMRKDMQKLLDEFTGYVREGLSQLSLISEKIRKSHGPKELVTMTSALYNYLKQVVDPANYSTIEKPVLYISLGKDGSINYQYYIEMTGVIDNNRHVFDEYFFVLTANVTSDGRLTFYINTLDSMETPGTFHIGQPVSSKSSSDLKRRAVYLLSVDQITSAIERKPMPMRGQELQDRIGKINGIVSAKVSNDVLYVILKKDITQREMDEVLKRLIPALKLVLQTDKTQSRLKLVQSQSGKQFVVLKTGKKSTNKAFQFVITSRLGKKDSTILKPQYDDLVRTLNLSPNMEKEFRKLMLKY